MGNNAPHLHILLFHPIPLKQVVAKNEAIGNYNFFADIYS